MRKFKRGFLTLTVLACGAPILVLGACSNAKPTADSLERDAQETVQKEANARMGMPAIDTFREKALLKEILERRDKGIVTYTYFFSPALACLTFVGDTVGYPIPYATQYSKPQKIQRVCASGTCQSVTLAQAEPNALFSASSADATWSLMKNPAGKDLGPVYSEPHLVSTPFKMPDHLLCDNTMKRFADILAVVLKKSVN